MTKKSHKTAERYAALSNQGKKKQQPKHHHYVSPVVTTTHQETADTEGNISLRSQTITRRRSELLALGHQHIVSDLKRIGIIGGVIVVVIIILTFVLG
ncbi:hypothetical protein ACFLVI_01990 [Chloroflexota bacterium]